MSRPTPPIWRSILYVPGNVPKFIDKARERGADCVLVDLEDSVQPAQKPEARTMLAEVRAAAFVLPPVATVSACRPTPGALALTSARPSPAGTECRGGRRACH